MAREIQDYRVSRTQDGRLFIGLNYVGGGYTTIQPKDAHDALFLIDVLRNERPVFIDQHGTIYTGPEPVGEGDPSPSGLPPAR